MANNILEAGVCLPARDSDSGGRHKNELAPPESPTHHFANSINHVKETLMNWRYEEEHWELWMASADLVKVVLRRQVKQTGWEEGSEGQLEEYGTALLDLATAVRSSRMEWRWQEVED
uniref:Uncharacterized protein n=1 Tax=Knipowitschia caucasica TaxID=637954 RepID=A0AAV2KDL0_KNICA